MHPQDNSTTGAAAPGLVHSQTSDTPLFSKRLFPGDYHLSHSDRALSRFRRLKKNVITSARLIARSVQSEKVRYRVSLQTLTYRPDVIPDALHITAYLKCLRSYFERRGWPFRYAWVAELGTIGKRWHYHVLVWVPRGHLLPKPDAFGWWPHGMTKVEWARNAVAYLAAYAAKGVDSPADAVLYSRLMPKGLRVFGAGGLSAAARLIRRWWHLPVYVRDTFGAHLDIRRCAGGGWVSHVTGEWWPPSYWIVFECGYLCLTRKSGGIADA